MVFSPKLPGGAPDFSAPTMPLPPDGLTDFSMARTELSPLPSASPLPSLALPAATGQARPALFSTESANDGLLESYVPQPLLAPERARPAPTPVPAPAPTRSPSVAPSTAASQVSAPQVSHAAGTSPQPLPAQHFDTFDLYLLHYEAGHVAPAARLDFREAISHDGQAPQFSEPGEYSVKLRRGGHVSLLAPTLSKDRPFTGCSFHLKSMKPAHCEFILVLARATDLVIFNPQGNDTEDYPVLILSKADQAKQVPPGLYAQPAVASTTLHLYALLEHSYQLWQQRTPPVEPSSDWGEQWEQLVSQT